MTMDKRVEVELQLQRALVSWSRPIARGSMTPSHRDQVSTNAALSFQGSSRTTRPGWHRT